MSDSKKLPTIEVGDTVVFRTDLEAGLLYGTLPFYDEMKEEMIRNTKVDGTDKNDNTFTVIGSGYWYSFEMVAEVLKPSKARVYSESEMMQCWNAATHDAFSVGDEDYKLLTFKDFIESLNTEGK